MENKKSSLFSQVKPYLKGFQLPLLIAFVGAAVSSIITVYGPDKLKEITNLITEGMRSQIDLKAISNIALFLAILYAAGALLNYVQSFIISSVIQHFSKRLRTAIAEKINKLPLRYFDSHSQGDTLSRVTNDVDTVGQSLNQSLGAVISSSLLLIAVLFMMFYNNVILSFVTIGSVLIGFVFVALIMGKSQRFFRAQQENLASVNGYVEEMYSGHNVIVSYNAAEESKAAFQTLNTNLYNSMWKSQFISGIMMPLMMFVGNFGYVMVVLVGASMALNGDVTMGTIVAFMVYVRTFSQPLSQIAQGITTLQQASAAMGRVFEFLAEPEMENDEHKAQQAGQKIAIVGPTGAGKTTIVNLLMKFYEIEKGRITIDGIDTKQMKRSEVHDAFSMVLQDTWLFEGTIKENLIYNQKNISDEAVVAAAKAVGVHHFIKTLPKGYDTVLDDTVSLSVGQKQLLTIARALLKDAPLLILDEATSSVDTRTEELIQKAMDKLMERRTSFVIAHRLSTIRNADLILVMRDGNIIEQGNHEQLMEQNGFYADLYNSQFDEEAEYA